jgi:hypothetical protein
MKMQLRRVDPGAALLGGGERMPQMPCRAVFRKDLGSIETVVGATVATRSEELPAPETLGTVAARLRERGGQ